MLAEDEPQHVTRRVPWRCILHRCQFCSTSALSALVNGSEVVALQINQGKTDHCKDAPLFQKKAGKAAAKADGVGKKMEPEVEVWRHPMRCHPQGQAGMRSWGHNPMVRESSQSLPGIWSCKTKPCYLLRLQPLCGKLIPIKGLSNFAVEVAFCTSSLWPRKSFPQPNTASCFLSLL